jgi:multiple sugar transport system permease protein
MASYSTIRKRRHLVLLIPVLVTVIVLIIIPLFVVIWLSLNKYTLVTPWKNAFVGLENYRRLMLDERFWSSLKVALYYGVGSVALQVILGLGLALLLENRYRATMFSRTVFLLPMAIPPIVTSLMWKLIFTPSIPGLNYMLGVIGIRAPNWFDDPFTALSTIIVANVWQWIPFCMITVLATLEALPTDPFESAQIDGANALQVFLHIKLPLLRPTLLFVTTYRVIESLKIFPLVHVMTGGGPGVSTSPVNYYAYKNAFEYNKMGYGSAIVMLMLVIVVLFVLFMTKVVKVNRGT